ncbi:hypothetical protein F4802DRAFT_90038 [Xylaria palmicola]|nr:hypothetical protein F4802DRAFT_90038 [Xylaria palmicola]
MTVRGAHWKDKQTKRMADNALPTLRAYYLGIFHHCPYVGGRIIACCPYNCSPVDADSFLPVASCRSILPTCPPPQYLRAGPFFTLLFALLSVSLLPVALCIASLVYPPASCLCFLSTPHPKDMTEANWVHGDQSHFLLASIGPFSDYELHTTTARFKTTS